MGAFNAVEVSHSLFGHYATTAPFGTDGGFYPIGFIDRSVSMGEIKRLVIEKNLDYLCIRSRTHDLSEYGFDVDRGYATYTLSFKGSMWDRLKLFSSKTRGHIRKAEKECFSIFYSHSVEDFYEVYSEHMRDLGSPAHSLQFLKSLLELCKEAKLILIKKKDEVIGGSIISTLDKVFSPLMTTVSKRYSKQCANYDLYWFMIREAILGGFHIFDFGRSRKGSNNEVFKMNWNPTVVPIYYNYLMRFDRKPPFVDPRNPRYRVPIEIWKRLPLALTRRIGSSIIKGIA